MVRGYVGQELGLPYRPDTDDEESSEPEPPPRSESSSSPLPWEDDEQQSKWAAAYENVETDFRWSWRIQPEKLVKFPRQKMILETSKGASTNWHARYGPGKHVDSAGRTVTIIEQGWFWQFEQLNKISSARPLKLPVIDTIVMLDEHPMAWFFTNKEGNLAKRPKKEHGIHNIRKRLRTRANKYDDMKSVCVARYMDAAEKPALTLALDGPLFHELCMHSSFAPTLMYLQGYVMGRSHPCTLFRNVMMVMEGRRCFYTTKIVYPYTKAMSEPELTRSHAHKLNQELSDMTLNLVRSLEYYSRTKVEYIDCKYLIDINNKIFFSHASEVFTSTVTKVVHEELPVIEPTVNLSTFKVKRVVPEDKGKKVKGCAGRYCDTDLEHSQFLDNGTFKYRETVHKVAPQVPRLKIRNRSIVLAAEDHGEEAGARASDIARKYSAWFYQDVRVCDTCYNVYTKLDEMRRDFNAEEDEIDLIKDTRPDGEVAITVTRRAKSTTPGSADVKRGWALLDRRYPRRQDSPILEPIDDSLSSPLRMTAPASASKSPATTGGKTPARRTLSTPDISSVSPSGPSDTFFTRLSQPKNGFRPKKSGTPTSNKSKNRQAVAQQVYTSKVYHPHQLDSFRPPEYGPAPAVSRAEAEKYARRSAQGQATSQTRPTRFGSKGIAEAPPTLALGLTTAEREVLDLEARVQEYIEKQEVKDDVRIGRAKEADRLKERVHKVREDENLAKAKRTPVVVSPAQPLIRPSPEKRPVSPGRPGRRVRKAPGGNAAGRTVYTPKASPALKSILNIYGMTDPFKPASPSEGGRGGNNGEPEGAFRRQFARKTRPSSFAKGDASFNIDDDDDALFNPLIRAPPPIPVAATPKPKKPAKKKKKKKKREDSGGDWEGAGGSGDGGPSSPFAGRRRLSASKNALDYFESPQRIRRRSSAASGDRSGERDEETEEDVDNLLRAMVNGVIASVIHHAMVNYTGPVNKRSFASLPGLKGSRSKSLSSRTLGQKKSNTMTNPGSTSKYKMFQSHSGVKTMKTNDSIIMIHPSTEDADTEHHVDVGEDHHNHEYLSSASGMQYSRSSNSHSHEHLTSHSASRMSSSMRKKKQMSPSASRMMNKPESKRGMRSSPSKRGMSSSPSKRGMSTSPSGRSLSKSPSRNGGRKPAVQDSSKSVFSHSGSKSGSFRSLNSHSSLSQSKVGVGGGKTLKKQNTSKMSVSRTSRRLVNAKTTSSIALDSLAGLDDDDDGGLLTPFSRKYDESTLDDITTVLPEAKKNNDPRSYGQAMTYLCRMMREHGVEGRDRCKEAGARNFITTSMLQYRQHAKLQERGIMALLYLLVDDVSDLYDDVVEAVLMAMDLHPSEQVIQNSGIILLGDLAAQDPARGAIGRRDGIKLIKTLVSKHVDDEVLVTYGCQVLNNMAASTPARALMVMGDNFPDTMAGILNAHVENIAVCEHMAVMLLLWAHMEEPAAKLSLAESDALQILSNRMLSHSPSDQLIVHFTAIISALASQQDLKTILVKIGVMNVIVALVSMAIESMELIACVLMAMRALWYDPNQRNTFAAHKKHAIMQGAAGDILAIIPISRDNLKVQRLCLATLAEFTTFQMVQSGFAKEHVDMVSSSIMASPEDPVLLKFGFQIFANTTPTLVKADKSLRSALLENPCLELAMKALLAEEPVAPICEPSLKIYTHLAAGDADTQFEIAEIGGINAVVSCMSKLPRHPGIQEVGSSLIRWLGMQDANRRLMASKGVLGVLYEALAGHVYDTHVQKSALMALRVIIQFQSIRVASGKYDIVGEVLATIGRNVEEHVIIRVAIALLAELTTTKDQQVRFLDSDGLDTLHSVLKLCKSDQIIVQQSLGVLLNLLESKQHSKDVGKEIASKKRLGMILEAVEENITHANILYKGASILKIATGPDLDFFLLEPATDTGGIRILIDGLRNHQNDAHVVEASLSALQRLIRPESKREFDPAVLVNILVPIIKKAAKSKKTKKGLRPPTALAPAVFKAIILSGTSSSEPFLRPLVPILTSIMSLFQDDQDIQEQCIETLDALVKDSPESQRLLVESEGMSALMTGMRFHNHSAAVIQHTAACVNSVYENKVFRHAVLVDLVINLLVSGLKMHAGRANVQAAGIGLLAAFVESEGQAIGQQIKRVGGLEVIQRAMQVHAKSNPAIKSSALTILGRIG